jgi:hypothetical protein
MRSTAEVLDHHLKCFADRDLDAVLADYSADAVFLAPNEHCADRMQLNLYLRECSPSSLNHVRPLAESSI